MINSLISKVLRAAKQFLVYQPPTGAKPFVLNEIEREEEAPPSSVHSVLTDKAKELNASLLYAKQLAKFMEETIHALRTDQQNQNGTSDYISELTKKLQVFTRQQAELSPILLSYTASLDPSKRIISASLEENKKLLKELYHSDINKDILLREFDLPGTPSVRGMLVFMDGMIDKQLIDLAILQPLMILTASQDKPLGNSLIATAVDKLLPSNQASRVTLFKDVMDGVNSGDSALFFEGASEAIVLGTKGYKQRGVERPQIEQAVRGSQSAFSEGLRTNTGLIRTLFPSNDLVTEIIMVGDRTPQKCAIMYLKSIANPQLVAEIRRRLKGIRTDYILNLGILEQYIEDHPGAIFPQVLSTERPDRTVAHLSEGRVALLSEGAPFALILPISFFTFFHSIEDFTLKPPAGTLTRMLRLVGALLSVLVPSAYLAISYFHQEALPTELALAIAGAREKVPFPAILEIIMMEVSFELIREAGLRIPGMLGSTIGIVGAIILGQAAVAANLVSPIMVVIISIGGLASFTIPDYRMAISLRIIRFGFLALAVSFGLVGVAFGILLLTAQLCSMKSFGIPYLAPVSPKSMPGYDTVVRGPVFRQENRPDELNTQDRRRQPHISRRWAQEKVVGKKGDDKA